MPRGAKPGQGRGGRPPGSKNRKTLLKQASLAAAAADPNISPKDFLLAVMRDPGAPIELRLQAARIAAPLVQPKPDTADAAAAPADPTPANCIDVITAKTLRDDRSRRRELEMKWWDRTLTAAEDKEAAEITERIAACEAALQCPPGYNEAQREKDRRRLVEIEGKRQFNRKHMNGVGLSETDDAEEALILARTIAFNRTRERRPGPSLNKAVRNFERKRREEEARKKGQPCPWPSWLDRSDD